MIGILGTVLFSVVKGAPTSHPRSVFRDFYLKMARTSYQLNVMEFANAYTDNELAANRKYKGKIVYIRGIVDEFKDEGGTPVVYKNMGNYNYEQRDTVKSIACRMQKRMLPILAKRKKGHFIGIVGEVVGLVSADSSIHLKNCLAVPQKEELDGSE